MLQEYICKTHQDAKFYFGFLKYDILFVMGGSNILNFKIEDFRLPVLVYLMYRSILIISTFTLGSSSRLSIIYYLVGIFIFMPFIVGYYAVDYNNKKNNIFFWLILLVIISIIFIITEPFYLPFVGTKDYLNSLVKRKDYLFMRISEKSVYRIDMYILDVLVYFIGNIFGYIKKYESNPYED